MLLYYKEGQMTKEELDIFELKWKKLIYKISHQKYNTNIRNKALEINSKNLDGTIYVSLIKTNKSNETFDCLYFIIKDRSDFDIFRNNIDIVSDSCFLTKNELILYLKSKLNIDSQIEEIDKILNEFNSKLYKHSYNSLPNIVIKEKAEYYRKQKIRLLNQKKCLNVILTHMGYKIN